MKYIDDIVWWIPIKKLRNAIRTYLINKINMEKEIINYLKEISSSNKNIIKYLNDNSIQNKDIINNLNKNFKMLKAQEDLHPLYLLRKKAALNTVEYIENNNNKAVMFYDKFQLLKFALENVLENFNNEDVTIGLFLEFGVFKGTTINFCSKILNNITFYGFDSFEGLPDNWYGWICKKKDFDINGQLPNKNDNVFFIKGYFENTIPIFIKENKEKQILFMHIDCDLYTSTKTILENVSNNIVSGTIIVFDEYFNYPNWEYNEYKAFQEFCYKYNISYEYIGFADQQVAVKIIRAEQSRAEQSRAEQSRAVICKDYIYINNITLTNKLQVI